MGEGASDPRIPPPLATPLGKVNFTRQANDEFSCLLFLFRKEYLKETHLFYKADLTFQ